MKKLMTMIATLSLLAMVGAGTARAQVIDAIVADIPFDFTVGTQTLPAGRYTVKPLGEITGSTMIISSAEGKNLQVFTTQNAQMNKAPHDAELIFHRVGDQYFLYEVFEQANPLGAMLPKPHAERRLEKEEAMNRDSGNVTVVAVKAAMAQR